MNPFIDVLGWSLRLGRLGRTEWRIGLLLLVWMLFEFVRALQTQPGWLAITLAPLIPLVVMLWHTAAHVWAVSLVGGTTHTATASILTEQNADQIPQRSSAVAMAAGSGPVASALLAAACWLAPDPSLRRLAELSLMVALVNLLACHPFDGRLLWRGLLWPVVGIRRAGQGTTVLAFLSVAVLIGLAIWWQDWLMLFLGVCCLLATLRDYDQQEPGYDPALQTDPRLHPRASRRSWWEAYQDRRAAAAEEATAAQVARDAEVLDRLLAKVSAHGLPALTEAERKTLQAISKRQNGD